MSDLESGPKKSLAEQDAMASTSDAAPVEQATTHVRFRGSLYRFMADPGTKSTDEGYSLGLNEIGMPLYQAVTAEFIGMFIYQLLFIAVSSGGGTSPFYLAIGQGILYFLLLITFGPVSGGHFNPLVTVATMSTGHTSLLRGLLYCVVQIIGALISESMFLNAMGKGFAPLVGTCGYGEELYNFNGGYLLTFNMVFYFLFLFLIFRVAMDPRQSSILGPHQTSILMGLIYGLFAFAYSGFATLRVYILTNPAICLASANGFSRDNGNPTNTEYNMGALQAWIGTAFTCVVFALVQRFLTPHYTQSVAEELSRNEKRLRMD